LRLGPRPCRLTKTSKSQAASAPPYTQPTPEQLQQLVAPIALYRSSGVMTFIVNEDGVVYQKDLGRKTDALAEAMKEYNPNSGWRKAEDQAWETAAAQQTK
jgi:DUF2950 family protein